MIAAAILGMAATRTLTDLLRRGTGNKPGQATPRARRRPGPPSRQRDRVKKKTQCQRKRQGPRYQARRRPP
jgi:hypothetical protein